jgi:hypothetical protein
LPPPRRRRRRLLLTNVAAASLLSPESPPCGGQLLPQLQQLPFFLGSQLQLAHAVTIELGLPSCTAQLVGPFSQVGNPQCLSFVLGQALPRPRWRNASHHWLDVRDPGPRDTQLLKHNDELSPSARCSLWAA